MKINRISAYTIDKTSSKPFLNFEDYSKFKYGNKTVSIVFAEKMTEALINELGGEYIIENSNELIISTSPYWYTPPSAFSLSLHVHSLLNELMLEHSVGPLQFVKIDRSGAPSCDFSKLSLAERKEQMKKNTLSADPALFKGKKLILVEDARITGSHEKKIIEHMEKVGLEELTFLYAIDVGETGIEDPSIEHRMNHSVVSDLPALAEVMEDPKGYYLNARACRFILSQKEPATLTSFCRNLNSKILAEIYTCSVNDGYGSMDEYMGGFAILKNEMSLRRASVKQRLHVPIAVSAERLLLRMKLSLAGRLPAVDAVRY